MANLSSGTGEFYTTRALKATPDYFKDLGENPLKPIALPVNYFHAAFSKIITDGIRVVQGKDRDPLPALGGAARTKEASIGALGGMLKGVGKVLTGKPLKGAAQFAEGAFNIIDIPISAVADGADAIVGVKHGGSQLRQNIRQTRAHVDHALAA